MAVNTIDSIAVVAVINNGTYDGKVKTANVNLGKMSVTNYDDDKALAVVESLESCLAKELYLIRKVVSSTLEASA